MSEDNASLDDIKESIDELKEATEKNDDRLRDLESYKVWTTAAATVAGVFLGFLGFSTWNGIATKIEETVDEKLQSELPQVIDQKVQQALPDAEPIMERIRAVAEQAVQAENIIQEVQSSQELFSRIAALENKTAKIGVNQCAWQDVGYDKSHEDDGTPWCPAGSFVSRLDLDADESRPQGSSPVVARAYCCTP